MSKKYRVIEDYSYKRFGLQVGDIVIKVENSYDDDLYEFPKHLHGKGHNADVYDKQLNLKERNYLYIDEDDLEEIKELENETE